MRMWWRESIYLFSYNKESTPEWWMGAVAWNVWTRASARRVASSSVNRASIDSNRRREMETGERAR